MKYIILLIGLTIGLFSDTKYELKLYQNILPIIFEKEVLFVFTQDEEQLNIIKDSSVFTVVKNCAESDLIIGKEFDKLPTECLDKPIFATSYRSFVNSQNSFGAFYWRKGRPQIKFKLENIEKYNLDLPNSLIKYAK